MPGALTDRPFRAVLGQRSLAEGTAEQVPVKPGRVPLSFFGDPLRLMPEDLRSARPPSALILHGVHDRCRK